MNCLYCGSEFTPKRVGGRHKGIFCSRECSFKSRLSHCKCSHCGKDFISNRKRTKFCSRECSLGSRRGNLNSSWKGGKVRRICGTCGIEYESFPSINKRFCSKKCSQPGKGKSGKLNPNWRGGGAQLVCPNCNKEFNVAPSQVNTKVYCSRECFFAHSFQHSSKRWKTKFGMSGTKSGKRADLGIFVRSAWEANYARYLNFLQGIGAVASWGYEEETFEFPVKRGTRSYTPDFKVKWNDGSVEYHEVKGWMHPKGKTALDRMGRYHPGIKIILIGQKEYRALSRQYRNAIPGWEIGSDKY